MTQPDLNVEQITAWITRDKGTATLDQDLARIQTGEPIDYVIGFCHFLNLKIDLSLRPLIPRPETEFWIGELIKTIPVNKTAKVLDLGAGSGCIGLAVLKTVPGVTVDFVDIDAKFLDQVKLNAEINQIDPTRFRLIQSNVWEGLETSEQYDYIATNPPYIPSVHRVELNTSVVDFEPDQALFAGEDGLAIIREIIAHGRDYLKPGGQLWLEFDTDQADNISELAKQAGYHQIEIRQDQYGRNRYAVLR